MEYSLGGLHNATGAPFVFTVQSKRKSLRRSILINEDFYCGGGCFCFNDADKSNFYSIFAPMKINQVMQQMISAVKARLARLPYRTGVVVTALCLPCYIISFAQMALPISTALKGVLWFIFFGLAKTFQYGGLAILGAKGLSEAFGKGKKRKNDSES